MWPHNEQEDFVPTGSEVRTAVKRHEKLIANNSQRAAVTELTYSMNSVKA